MFFPVSKVHVSGSIFSGICQVRAWSCIAKVNRNFSVPFYFILHNAVAIKFHTFASDLQPCEMNKVCGC